VTDKQLTLSENDLVDFHSHSTANDGRWTPAALTKAASDIGIRVLALTDHDTTAAVPAFLIEAESRGILGIPGLEVSCWWRDTIQHVLLLGVDLGHPELVHLLGGLWAEVKGVAERSLSDLARHGYRFPGLEERAAQGFDVLPIHVLVAALEAKLAPTFPEVVRFLNEDLRLSLASGVEMAAAVAAGQASGGVAVLAHPGRAEYGFTTNTVSSVTEMVEATNLDGLEVYHWSHGQAEIESYSRLAAKLGLLVSCGSDSHGPNSQRALRGWEARLCRSLLRRLGVEVVGEARGSTAR
jgi:3',5'-nucleoside bisphosphate phosphatase